MSTPAPEKKEPAKPQLPPMGLALFETNSLRHDAVIPMGVPPAALLEPTFWSHHAVKLAPWHEIRARAADGTWVANYLVLDTSRTWARVKQLDFHRLTTGDQADTQASAQEVKEFIARHQVKHRGAHRWTILDGEHIIEEGIASKEEANAKLETLARQAVGGAAGRSAVPA
jgi:hypothetical protein